MKRANPSGIPVRLYDGALVAHVAQDLADKLLNTGAAELCRRGPRRYLRLRQGISIPRTIQGWSIMEFLRDVRTVTSVPVRTSRIRIWRPIVFGIARQFPPARQRNESMNSTGNLGLDALADAIAVRVAARLNQSTAPRLMNVSEAAAYIGRSEKALRHMIASGSIPCVRDGSRVQLDRVDVDRWVEMRKEQR
jgi:excisionase family DNA binding protein